MNPEQLFTHLKKLTASLSVGQVAGLVAVFVAVVGSRAATPYGLHAAKVLAGDLAQRGVSVVSGLARGIDGAAHEGALEAEGRTIGVLGCGLDVVYPREHRRLYERVAESGAVVIGVRISESKPANAQRRASGATSVA